MFGFLGSRNLRWLRELKTLQLKKIEKAPANQDIIFINMTAGAANAHNIIK